nr:SPOR domain-containing protein [Fictibacillus sp. 7GRE50]
MYECVVRAVCREEGVKYQPIAAQKPVVKDTTKKKLFRVQVGAFAEKTNADRLVKELEAKGYKPFVKED